MALLKHPTMKPPGGFVYRQAETGLKLEGDSLHNLIAKVVAHRRYKKLTPDDEETVGLEVQRQICTRLGLDECKEEAGDVWVPVPTQPRFTLNDILAFSKTALEFVRQGAGLVSVPVAMQRRTICAACPLNQPASGCKCGTFYKMVNAAIPKERQWEDLHVCQLCSCSLKAKVNVPMSVLAADTRKISWPVHCWMHPSPAPDHKVLPPAS